MKSTSSSPRRKLTIFLICEVPEQGILLRQGHFESVRQDVGLFCGRFSWARVAQRCHTSLPCLRPGLDSRRARLAFSGNLRAGDANQLSSRRSTCAWLLTGQSVTTRVLGHSAGAPREFRLLACRRPFLGQADGGWQPPRKARREQNPKGTTLRREALLLRFCPVGRLWF